MAIAYQCDRCKELFVGHPPHLVSTMGPDNHQTTSHLCEDCASQVNMVLEGRTVGPDERIVDRVKKILNDALAFPVAAENEEVRCGKCYHRDTCGQCSAYCDATQCKLFISMSTIMLGAEKRLKLIEAAQKAIAFLNTTNPDEVDFI